MIIVFKKCMHEVVKTELLLRQDGLNRLDCMDCHLSFKSFSIVVCNLFRVSVMFIVTAYYRMYQYSHLNLAYILHITGRCTAAS